MVVDRHLYGGMHSNLSMTFHVFGPRALALSVRVLLATFLLSSRSV